MIEKKIGGMDVGTVEKCIVRCPSCQTTLRIDKKDGLLICPACEKYFIAKRETRLLPAKETMTEKREKTKYFSVVNAVLLTLLCVYVIGLFVPVLWSVLHSFMDEKMYQKFYTFHYFDEVNHFFPQDKKTEVTVFFYNFKKAWESIAVEINGIYLENPFLRTEQGSSYVYVMGSDGRLEKRTVTVGEYNMAMDTYEVLDGLTENDHIAFPDGELCREGAPTTREKPESEDSMVEVG